MRLHEALLAMAVGATLWAGSAEAQNALEAAGSIVSTVERPVLVLRPEPEMRHVAEQVKNVLELRSGGPVEIGDAPPPGLLEAVPTGHVAIARGENDVILVVGIAGGSFLEAHLPIAMDGKVDTRAVALALEALRDAALDYSVSVAESANAPEEDGAAAANEPQPQAPYAAAMPPGATSSPTEPEKPPRLPDDGLPRDHLMTLGSPPFLEDVEPFAFVRSYAGASSSSDSTELGMATGVGLCSVGQCLVLTSEVPVTRGGTNDLRYRYVTFLASVYSRPVQFGAFTPGVSVGFLSRVGHFDADMGLSDGDGRLDTDLGVRASAEFAVAVVQYADVMAEAGMDIALDRTRASDGTTEVARGQKVSPWLQFALRLRTPYK